MCLSFSDVLSTIENSTDINDIEFSIITVEFLLKVLITLNSATYYYPNTLLNVSDTNVHKNAFNKIEFLIEQLNLKQLYDEKKGVILVEASPSELKAAESVPESTGKLLLSYRHHSMKNDLQGKSQILASLAKYLEGYKSKFNGYGEISNIYNGFTGLANNCDIRHDASKNGKWQKLSTAEKHECYDKLFNLAVLCINLVDYLNNTKADIEKYKVKS